MNLYQITCDVLHKYLKCHHIVLLLLSCHAYVICQYSQNSQNNTCKHHLARQERSIDLYSLRWN